MSQQQDQLNLAFLSSLKRLLKKHNAKIMVYAVEAIGTETDVEVEPADIRKPGPLIPLETIIDDPLLTARIRDLEIKIEDEKHV